jgi:hypothetical protein
MPAGVFGSAILEVAIGILFLYFLLSTVCSSINEIIATILRWRSKNLEQALLNLVPDSQLRTQILNHPLITAMGSQPSYLSSRTFSLALLHSLSGGDGSMSMTTVRTTAQSLATSAAQAGQATAQQLTGQALVALIDATRDPQGEAQALATVKKRVEDGLQISPPPSGLQELRQQLIGATSLDGVRDAVATLPEGPPKVWAQGVVESARQEIDTATYKLEDVRRRVELWFDHAMDRASGAYKRDTLKVLAIIAVLLTIVTGADTVKFVSRLYVDTALRAELTQQATQPGPVDITQAVQQLEPAASLFGYADFPSTSSPDFPRWMGLKFGGEILTIFALLLGAPFWFDLLTKVANLRGTGPPPASTSDAERARAGAGAANR